ncbi:MAG: PQQ-like beta-propeller repeat protein, partial [bacterium]|nr:PQQ-like beta-propeller repeat protein [bacterium]
MSDSTDPKPVCWWPALLIAGLAILALLAIWIPDSPQRAVQVLKTVPVILIGSLLLLLWFSRYSRLSKKIRVRSLAILVLLIALGAVFFRLRGFTGDMVPILDWRWSTISTLSPSDETESLGIDYPQFLGPHRNATLPNVHLDPEWESNPPRLLWQIPVGEAWSAFAVSGRSAITQEQQDEQETVACYDLLTGQEKWRYTYTARYATALGGIGPRATPTIDGERVYTFGATGVLTCLDVSTGQEIWSRDTVKETGARVNDWGMSGSPLILNDRVIVSPGGPNGQSLMAYHKNTGAIIWGGGNRRAGYSSPSLTTLAGVDQILIFNTGQVASHDPDSGKLLWQHPWATGNATQHIVQPVPLPDNRLFISTGYGIGCQLLQIANEQDQFKISILWETRRLKAKFTNVVHNDGYLYGLDDGILVCLDLQDTVVQATV